MTTTLPTRVEAGEFSGTEKLYFVSEKTIKDEGVGRTVIVILSDASCIGLPLSLAVTVT